MVYVAIILRALVIGKYAIICRTVAKWLCLWPTMFGPGDLGIQ